MKCFLRFRRRWISSTFFLYRTEKISRLLIEKDSWFFMDFINCYIVRYILNWVYFSERRNRCFFFRKIANPHNRYCFLWDCLYAHIWVLHQWFLCYFLEGNLRMHSENAMRIIHNIDGIPGRIDIEGIVRFGRFGWEIILIEVNNISWLLIHFVDVNINDVSLALIENGHSIDKCDIMVYFTFLTKL